jgi:hypothetical protein
VLLNVLADEIHRAHQRCLTAASCDPRLATRDLVFEAGATAMRALKGAYSCLCLIKGVGLVAFRDPFGIRRAPPPVHGFVLRGVTSAQQGRRLLIQGMGLVACWRPPACGARARLYFVVPLLFVST